MTAEALIRLVTGYKYMVAAEHEFQNGVAQVLELHGISHWREHDLGEEFGRIDFYLPATRIGMELKVKGSPSEVLRQLHRYALSPEIDALVLLTGRSRLSVAPAEINRKPVLSAALWSGQL
jgi:hypothetical protein